MKKSNGVGRRGFLKTVSLAGLAAEEKKAGAAQTGARANAARTRAGSQAAQVEYPRIFTGPQLAMIAFPLGGVAAGSISLGGRGQLRDWEIFNRAEKGNSPNYAFASIWAKSGSRRAVARVLEARLQPPYQGPSGLGSENVPGLPRLESCSFTGEFPLARIEFQDTALPVRVALEAFTPFIPHEADDSGLPVAILRYRVTNPATVAADVGISLSIDSPVGKEGRSNDFRQGSAVEGLLMRNPFLAATDPLAGSFAVSVLKDQGKVTYLRGWRAGTGWPVGPLIFWDDFSSDGELGQDAPVKNSVGSLCLKRNVPAKSQAEYTFLLSWYFPNRTPAQCGWTAPKDQERKVIGNHYCTRFTDAWAAAEYAGSKLPDLEKRTRQFAGAMRDSTLPGATVDGATANLSTLVTPTAFRTSDGAFHGFEGSFDKGGCCFGNCTHVYNYESATAHVFPSLSRSLRENAFGFCTDDRGLQDFRQILPAGVEKWGKAAADGQMGQIMKLYLDWHLSGNDDWLRRHWPAAKRALGFAWIEGGWDADKDGVMEGVQHNTYDVEFYGPNPLCGIWYLGALRAGEEMARFTGDNQSADEYRRLFENGSKWIDANLFNGEYYIQKVRGVPKDKIAPGLLIGMGSASTEAPEFQVGDGCLADQLLGQYFAHIAGLGYLLDRAHVRKALESIYKYNFKRSLFEHQSVQRTYVLNDEAALVVCDYGRSTRPEVPFPYFSEAWTGQEYAVAAMMIYEGLVPQGTEVISAIRRRFDGQRRNPWNEPECGHHYARAMSSWSCLLALSGFHYNARERAVTASPRINPDKFRSFWSTGTGWGSFSQSAGSKQTRFTLSVDFGQLTLRSLELGRVAAAPAVKVGGTTVDHEIKRKDSGTVLLFSRDITLKEGDQLAVTL